MSLKIERSLLKGSFILLISFNIYNLLNFVFNALMARLLGVSDYSAFLSLAAMTYIVGVFTESIQTEVVRKISKQESNEINAFRLMRKRSLQVTTAIIIVYLACAYPLSILLDISLPLIFLNGLVMFGSLSIAVSRGILQGRQQFVHLGGSMVLESSTKIICAALFIYLGWSIFGALVGIIFGLILALVFSLSSIRELSKKSKLEQGKITGSEIDRNQIDAFITILSVVAFYSLDIILARIFFDPATAGAYGIAAILGKAVFWGTQPISKAMLPLSSGRSSENKSTKGLLINSLAIIFAIDLFALAIFFFFPGVIIELFSGMMIAESIEVLFQVGIAMALLSFTNAILFYKLSKGATKGMYLLPLAIIIEGVILFYFRSSLSSFSTGLVVASVVFMILALVFLKKSTIVQER